MTIKEVEKLIHLLRSNGVSHFKSLECEISFVPRGTVVETLPVVVPQPKVSKTKAPPAQAAPPVQLEIPHHVNEVAKLMKLSDNDLVDALFPDPTEPKDE